MKLTVIGHLCKDFVHLPKETDDSMESSYGGILYSVLTLAHVMEERDTIYPIFGVGIGDYDDVIARLKKFPNIDVDGIFRFKGRTNEVHLFVQPGHASRIECSKDISSPIPYSKIKSYLDADGVLINMISGSDIALETLDMIRIELRENRIPIHLDFHSLTLGIDQEFKRFRRPLPEWRRWCFMMNSIQLSEDEAAGLTTEGYDEQTLINHLMPLMVNAFIVTRGDRGATLVQQDIHKKLTRTDMPAFDAGPTVETVGCGDVFGASYLFEFVRTKNPIQAAIFANRMAAVKSTFRSIENLHLLRSHATTREVSQQL
ncbi:MAG: carbohydrate kinase family protein [Ignavibacteriales bacterium]|nr:carbohydrate kinase family protein [Ignavibacteriales bacterium]